jgi:PAS domain-containing protein
MEDKGEIDETGTSASILEDATEALLIAKLEWEDIFNSINDMVTIHDKDFNIIFYNTAAKRFLGLPNLVTSDVVKCYQYYHGTDCPPKACPSCRCLQTQQQVTSEVFEPHLNMFLEITAIPRFDGSGQLKGLVHIVRDITERKKAEESLKETNARIQMVATPASTSRSKSSSAKRSRNLLARVCLISPQGTWRKSITQRISNSFIIQAFRSMAPRSRTPVELFTM